MIPTMIQLLESEATDQAEKMNLDYMKFGRWGKNGTVTHVTNDKGKLEPVKKKPVPKAAAGAGKPAPTQPGKPGGKPTGQAPTTGNIKIGNIEIGPNKKSVLIHGKPVKMSDTEYKLLKLMATGKGKIHARGELLQQVWDAAPDIITRTVDMYVSRLKRKLANSGANIQSVRGMGYKMHDLPESLSEGSPMTELTPEIQNKLLDRARKNIQWYKKLESVLTKMDESDPKKEKVEKVANTLKVQALLIIKSLKDIDGDDGNDDGELETNATPVENLRRNPTRNNSADQMSGGGGAAGI